MISFSSPVLRVLEKCHHSKHSGWKSLLQVTQCKQLQTEECCVKKPRLQPLKSANQLTECCKRSAIPKMPRACIHSHTIRLAEGSFVGQKFSKEAKCVPLLPEQLLRRFELTVGRIACTVSVFVIHFLKYFDTKPS